jgi:peroxiredoxin family protein
MADRLLLLAHSGGFDRLHQLSSCAAAATTQGQAVDIVYFFGALSALLEGRLDEMRLEPRDEAREAHLQARVVEHQMRPPSANLQAAAATGLLRSFACSASLALAGGEPERAAAVVDEIIGWPTVIRLMGTAGHVLYI